jgi:hypothetical protein
VRSIRNFKDNSDKKKCWSLMARSTWPQVPDPW